MPTAAAPQKAQPKVAPEPTFVFGARVNIAGDDPTARVAARFHGAAPEVWNGPTGNAYALPCRTSEGAALSPRTLGSYLAVFFKYATEHPQQRFRISRFGCGQGELTDADMAKLWRNAPSNCLLPALWQRELGEGDLARILIFDPLVRLKSEIWRKMLQRYMAVNLPLWGATRCEFLSSGGPRDSLSTAAAAQSLGYPHREVRADSGYYQQQADLASDMLSIWSATHLLSVTDPDQTSVPSHVRMLKFAMRDGLFVDDLSADESGLG